ncbi:VOC family protein [Rhodococcus aetherivorans]|uniref:VOC family protein n=1 Tax=Rhodococcus TaxID=1827 RepID=UPI000622CA7A|nr:MULTISPECIES: VOC family protein [Rhodococcus]NCL76212.1 hypothetical protein [Rhodococcus sp. YH1]AKE88410.1 glyoxalase [Rhodococcus aetherivorans]ANZ26970.1 glyoxalase [Rhodococcus sp. WB1]MDV6297352.1 VOC family protein [Rhodococcus aetherivorans]PND49787.1 glyoxalase [Rhodococcus sp. ENV425]
MTAQLALVGLVVADMTRSFDCYRRLGLDLPAGSDEPHYETTLPGGLRLAWDTLESVRTFHPGFRPGTGGPALAFDCGSPADVDATYRDLLEAGCTSVLEPWDAFWKQRYASVHDPDGHSIELFAALPA